MSSMLQENSTPRLQVSQSGLVEFGPSPLQHHRSAPISSRSISWNASGSYLAYACSDRTARIVSLDTTSLGNRDVTTLSGHNGPVMKVRFHPSLKDSSTILTASTDQTIRLWDVRNPQKPTASCEGKHAVSLEWGRDDKAIDYFVVTERNGKVSVYDKRNLVKSSGKGATTTTTPVHVFDRAPNFCDCAMFSPNGGEYLVGGLTYKAEGMADIGIWRWKKDEKSTMDTDGTTNTTTSTSVDVGNIFRYAAHAGPIYDMDLSPDGKRMVTGGSDALVGLWDVDTMICTHTVSKHITKLVRSVAFSHDGKIVAVANEENDIQLAEASTGISLPPVALGRPRGGAEEVAWHPSSHILACARTELNSVPTPPPIAVVKLTVTNLPIQ